MCCANTEILRMGEHSTVTLTVTSDVCVCMCYVGGYVIRGHGVPVPYVRTPADPEDHKSYIYHISVCKQCAVCVDSLIEI